MRELFGEFGGLKSVQMHFDSKGKSQGVCDIHFKNRADGLRAVKKYNSKYHRRLYFKFYSYSSSQ